MLRFELFPHNLTCPSFYSCSLVDTLRECSARIGTEVRNRCAPVSTLLVEMVAKSNGRSVSYERTNNVFPGPAKVMALVHRKWEEWTYENCNGLIGVGLGVTVGAYGLYKLTRFVTAPPAYLANATKDGLQQLLQNADVSVGHWNGRQICFKGHSERATFSQVSHCIERIYSKSVEFMRTRQQAFKWSQAPGKAYNESAKIICSTANQISSDEEKSVRDAIKWRSDMHVKLHALFSSSHNLVNKSGNLKAMSARQWDKILDKMSKWRNGKVEKDEIILEQMIRNRK